MNGNGEVYFSDMKLNQRASKFVFSNHSSAWLDNHQNTNNQKSFCAHSIITLPMYVMYACFEWNSRLRLVTRGRTAYVTISNL